MTRGKILDMAKAIINGERNDRYGAPEDSFELIGTYWGIYLASVKYSVFSSPIKPKDVAMMMALMKVAREAHQGRADNLIDAVAYLALAGDLEDDEAQAPD